MRRSFVFVTLLTLVAHLPFHRQVFDDPSTALPPSSQLVVSTDQAILHALNKLRPTERGLELQHPRHNAEFTSEGVTFTPRRGPGWHWELAEVRFGANAPAEVALRNVAPRAEDQLMVRYPRGPVEEQYVLRTNSIEQRFVILQRPSLDDGDLIITGAVQCEGAFEAATNGWLWRTAEGVVSLGKVHVFDAKGKSVRAAMKVNANETQIMVEGLALAAASYPVTIDPEIGTNDFRISDAEVEASNPAIVYNGDDNEYLVVWHGFDTDGQGIFGQRINAANGDEVGENDFRISYMPVGPYMAHSPAVAYNSVAHHYLVVWSGNKWKCQIECGDDDTIEDEIYGQNLTAIGDTVGPTAFRISDMGPDQSGSFDAREPEIAYNSSANEYLVVWQGDDAVDGEFEIFAQRIAGTGGNELGDNDFRISDMGPEGDTGFDALLPAVFYNQFDDEYLVVWGGDEWLKGEREIFGQLLSSSLAEIGNNDFRISDMGSDLDINFSASHPAVAYNCNSYLIVWVGDDLVDGEFEIYGQLLDRDAEIGINDFRISNMGSEGNTDFGAALPAASYNSINNEYFVVWSGDDSTEGEDEMYGQVLDGQTGAVLLPKHFRLSDMGPDKNPNFDAGTTKVFNYAGHATTQRNGIAYNFTDNEYLLVWSGNDSLEETYFQIFGQRYLPEGSFGQDVNTTFALDFEHGLAGLEGENPTTALGINFVEGIRGAGAHYPQDNQLFYPSSDNLDSQVGTLEFWIKPDWSGDDDQDHYVLNFGEDGGMGFWKDAGNYWRFIMNRFGQGGNPELEVSLYAVPTFQTNEWHHAAFTWDNTSLKLYLDGQLRDETPVTFPLPIITDATFQIGAEGANKYLEAVLDNLRISQVVRSEEEIVDHINSDLKDLACNPINSMTIVADQPFGLVESFSKAPQSLIVNVDPLGLVHVPLKLATWQSSNPGVAAVDGSGNITGISGGTATITATFYEATAVLDVVVIPRYATANGNPLIDFAAPKIFEVGQSPTQIAVGDWDRDGRLDLGVSSLDLSRVEILKGDGAGNFSATGNYAVSARPFDVIAADLNADNKLDLITGSDDYSGHNASVLLGDGTGQFSAAAQFPLDGDGVYKIVAHDVNHDNKLDLLSANQFSDNVSIIIGNGAGNFGAATTFPLATGVGPQGLGIGDLNRDNKQDLITANRNHSTVSVLLGDGNGNFAAPSYIPVGQNPRSLLLGDLNRDNRLDVVTINYTSDDVTVLLGDGAGGFSSIANYALSDDPGTAALLGDIGDLNGDGKLDLAIGAGNYLAVMLGNGTGEFEAVARYPFRPNDFVRTAKIGNFDNAHGPDLVVTVMDWNNYADSKIAVFLSNTYGYSNTVSTTGPVNFPGADVTALFTEKNGTDEFYAALITDAPEGESLPEEVRLLGERYWVIRKFGDGSFTADLTFIFPAGTISAADVANPGNFKLYRRDDTSTGPWSFLTVATSATATSVTFSGISSLSQFAIGTSSKMVLLAQDKITLDHYDAVEGAIHANGDILFENGNPGTLTGDVSAVGKITIKRKNHIIGNVTAGGKVFVDSKAQVDGVISEYAAVSAIPLPQLNFTCDGAAGDVYVKKDKEKSVTPGSYGACYLEKDAKLKLAHNGSTGEYFFKTLNLEGEAMLSIDVTRGAVAVNVCEELTFIKDGTITILGGDSRSLVINYLGTKAVELGNDGFYQGILNAPNALVEIGSEAFFQGAIAAKSIMVEKDADLKYHNQVTPKTSVATPEEAEQIPTEHMLEQNYPNPFNPSTTIRYALPKASEVKVLIYNTTGQLVRHLFAGPMPAGYHHLVWDATDDRGQKAASGVYVYVLRAGEFVAKRKLVLLK